MLTQAQEEAVRSTVMERLEARARKLLEAGSAELARFAEVIAYDLARAAALGRPDLVEALTDQLEARAEALRIRAAHEAWAELREVLRDLAAVPLALANRGGEA